MRILIYGINYSPELTGIGKYTGQMGAWLVQRGHTVDVITAMPYYPEWTVHPNYKRKWWFREMVDGARVRRCPLYVPQKVTPMKRIMHEFSFVVSSLPYWFRVFFDKRYDVVICISPPFHVGMLPSLYSKWRRVPFWCHLQDLQVDMAKELGMLTNERFLAIMFSVEQYILKRCTKISTISEGMVRKVMEKNSANSPCILFPNWVDEHYIRPMSREASLRAQLGLNDQDKVVMYSGSLGEKQGLELIIEAARYFVNDKAIKFLIVGSGSGREYLQALANRYKLTNVSFHSLQPYEKLSALLASADIHLLLQKRAASDLVLPSKLTSILAAGGCTLISAVAGTTLYEIVAAHRIGILIEPESVESLQAGIELAFRTDLSVIKQNAQHYAASYLSKEVILREFEKELLSL